MTEAGGPNRVTVFPQEDVLARAAADAIATVISARVAQRGRCAIALSGGSTPRVLYRELASAYRTAIPWDVIDVFWGDERFVPATHTESNYGMARAVLLDHVPCPAANVHPIPTGLATAAAAADAYAAELRVCFGEEWPQFDLLLLGIGADGHIASLFPHSPALDIHDRTVAAASHPHDHSPRVTLTMPVLLAAHTTFLLATGGSKAAAISRALDLSTDIAECPAAGLRNADGEVVWWLDRGAAERLEGMETSSHGGHGKTEASES